MNSSDPTSSIQIRRFIHESMTAVHASITGHEEAPGPLQSNLRTLEIEERISRWSSRFDLVISSFVLVIALYKAAAAAAV
jgi:hypothetical protein